MRARSAVPVVALTAMALALTACGGSPTGSAASGSPDAGASACGTVPDLGVNDPDGLLDPGVIENHNGYPNEVKASAWADWKPDHAEPYTAALVSPPPTNPYIITVYDTIRSELADAGVEIIADFAVAEPTDVPGQLQQFNEAVALDPDIIFFTALAPGPAAEAVTAAQAAGIPVVAPETAIDSDAAVSVVRNSILETMEVGAGVLDAMGGEGSVLKVAGIPGIAVDTLAWIGFDAVLAECPDVTVAGEITGGFVPATAQAEATKFLATNPAGAGGALNSGTMGYPVLQAFEDAGLEVPPIGDNGATMGFINWAAEHPEYPYIGTAAPPAYVGEVYANVGLRILAGEGPKVNLIVGRNQVITANDVAALADPDAEPGSQVTGDPESVLFPPDQLDLYFTNPGALE